MFGAFMYNGQVIFGEAEPADGVDKTKITNPMTIVNVQQHPSQPPQAMIFPILPGDPTKAVNTITYSDKQLAKVEGDIVSELEPKYIQATSRIQIAGGTNKFN